MLTPRFKLEQDDKFVTVKIYAPFTNVSETEVFMDDQDFRFFSKPYFLRLHFPSQIEENEHASATFDADSLSFIVKCPKVCQGQFFPNLDMISELCKPPNSSVTVPDNLIQELDTPAAEEEETDWYFEQKIPSDGENEPEYLSNGIGFGLNFTNVFERLSTECQEVLDVKNPGQLSVEQRCQQQVTLESQHFDSDHYLSDLLEPDESLQEALKFQWKISLELTDEDRVELVDMASKGKKSIRKGLRVNTLCAINEVIFAYCYDLRTNLGEHCSESAWTIAKLCPSLVCSSLASNVKESTIGSLRRSLIYPLYRSYALSTAAFNDTLKVWASKVSVVKVLLSVIKLFQESEGRYIFNDLYLQHYLKWIQSVKSEKIADFVQELKLPEKADLDLDLIELENAAELVQRENEHEELIQGIENLCANQSDSDDDSSSSSSSSDDETTDSSETEDDSTPH